MRHAAVDSAAMTDEQLMRCVQADDDRAFELLYDRHRHRVWELAQVLCRPEDVADRVVEDALIAVWRERAAYDSERESVQAWTMRLVYHRAMDPHRLGQRPDRPCANEVGSARPDAGARGDEAPAAQALRGLLDRLPADQREIIALAFYGGLTHAQIAELLDLPPGTIKGRMRLGLHKLRRVMGEGDTGADPPG